MVGINTSFRASYGLDAAGEKVINVALADKSVLTDGVNVEYLIQENTIQQYDSARGYTKSFAVIFNNRIWLAKNPIAKPAGVFNETLWSPLRTDPKWYPVDSGVRQLQVGDYITVDTAQGNPVELTLPSDAQDGDNIVIKDVGGFAGISSVIVKAGIQSIIDKGVRIKTAQMTVPFSEWVFVYVNKLWNLYNGSEADLGRFLKPSATPQQIQAGETIIRQYDRQSPIILKFPKYANNGDMIHFVGMDNNSVPYFHLELQSFDATSSVVRPGTTSTIIQRSLSGYFIYSEEFKTWLLFDADMTDRLRTVSSDTNLFPNETVSVVGSSNDVVAPITLTLPQNVSPGDQITIALNYMRLGQTVNIVPGGTDKILTTKELTQFPKRSTYPPVGNWVNTTKLTYSGKDDYPPVITLAYIDMGPIKQWLVVDSVPALERVDSLNNDTRARLGVIALANATQAQVDHENSPNTDTAITPELLAKRVATEEIRGIAKIAKQADVNKPSDDPSYADDLIVTPKKLDAKKASETMRGLAEIATQTETNTNSNDTHIITPKKLDGRRATANLSGVVQLVETGGTSSTARNDAGTGVFNYADNARVVTPTTLREFKASETQQGTGFLALGAEVIAGTPNPAGIPLLVTPEQLHKKTAQEDRIGFTQTATQTQVTAGTDDFTYVSPKKLAARISTESLAGIAKIATQIEFNDGTPGMIAAPDKIKDFFSQPGRTSVVPESGLTQSGNIWTTTRFDIVAASESQRGTLKLATQPQTDAGTDDTTAITPKKLHAKKATGNTEGIIRIARADETTAGTSDVLAVCPLNLKNTIQVEKTWEAQTTVRGTVKMTENALTFVGNDVSGSTANLETYLKTGYAISPYELNKTLLNFMPRKAKAVDSDLLDGLDSSQFIRRDIDQVVNGTLDLAKNFSVVGTSSLSGMVNIGKNGDGTFETDKTRIRLKTPKWDAEWLHTLNDSQLSSVAKYSIGYNNAKTITMHGADSGANILQVHGELNADKSVNVADSLNVTRHVYVANGSYWHGDKTVIAKGTDPNNLLLGNTEQTTYVRTIDANNLMTQDAGNNYKILNQKNMNAILDPIYVNAAGDSMTGRLNISAPITASILESQALVNNAPSANNFGTWTLSVTSSTVYNLLPGYVVGVPEINNETGLPTGYIDHYDEFKGPGTLSQMGSSASNGIGTYQIWAPRPASNTVGHMAQTFWTRQWNPVTSKWDGWGRMYTSNNPPTAKDIGAMSDNGSVFSSLRIRDWIQIGNLRIYADPATKNVRFDWID
ncbi:tail fiber protein proximal subunit [Acinetobacter phage Acj9]|uniref:Gp34 long tail fiber proximal subunit n=1 Tax=Acinetobacter phage Acj9 TaxID=760939 RepID=E5EQ25_9CAUD|nr:tail fiber protein proximal subunit [Acinetobacter phage Acj9]ADG60141.1 gp34 long tail fiber proximal subunit [Acinetobacter phage Acj9]